MKTIEPAHDRARQSDRLRRRALRSYAILVCAGLLGAATPAPGVAQSRQAVVGQVGGNPAAPGGLMVGLAAETSRGVLSARAGASMDAAGTVFAGLLAPSRASSGAWTADIDAGVNLGEVPYVEDMFGRMDPTVFGGAGLAGVTMHDPDGVSEGTSLVPTWSWGLRTAYPFTSWLGLEAEVRHRETVGEVSTERYPLREGWEYDAGLAIRFGGGGAARPLPASRPRTRQPAVSGGRTSDTGPAERGAVADAPRTESAEAVAARTIRTAERYVGSPYRWGGASPDRGFDCSGFVQYVFAAEGIALPRVSRDQARAGVPLPTDLDGVAPGDLLFFARDGSRIDHVAIYAGDGRIVHSSNSGHGVRYDDLNGNRGRWYAQHLVAVRRVIQPETYGTSDGNLAGSRRLPLDEAFDALAEERGDDAPPPSGS